MSSPISRSINSGDLLRRRPFMRGIAQKAHFWLQPSEILTYALGPVATRGGISRSSRPGGASSTRRSDEPGAARSSRSIRFGREAQLRAPSSPSSSGSSPASSSPYRSTRQPVAISFWCGRFRSPSSSKVSTDSCLALSMKPHVLTTRRSDSSGRSTCWWPAWRSSAFMASESTWFLLQPSVTRAKRRPPAPSSGKPRRGIRGGLAFPDKFLHLVPVSEQTLRLAVHRNLDPSGVPDPHADGPIGAEAAGRAALQRGLELRYAVSPDLHPGAVGDPCFDHDAALGRRCRRCSWSRLGRRSGRRADELGRGCGRAAQRPAGDLTVGLTEAVNERIILG